MDCPQPPRDTSLRNIIDKLAEFVARNGPEFESITKAKQKGNPKFEFLYGGEFYTYYQYRVASEQAFLKQQASISQAQQQQINNHSTPLSGISQQSPSQQHSQQIGYNASSINNNIQLNQITQMNQMNQMPQQSLWTSTSNGSASSNSLTSQIEAINMQQNTLREQIMQSEQNLSAQHGVLLEQQQKQIEEAITKAQNDTLHKQADDNNIRLAEFDAILQPIIESCTKDSISTGKNWILQHTSDTAKCNVVLQYLLKKALINGSSFTQKLHLIYLVNDVLHHCVRKNANDLKSCLENVVIPMFCSAEIIAADDQKAKLRKLLSLWESKAKFFDACVISKLRSPESSMQEYKTNLMNVHNNIVNQFTQATKAALDSYQHQHQIFIQHATQQISVLETQKQALEAQVLAKVLPNAATLIPQLIESQQLHATFTQLQSPNLNPGGLLGTANQMNSSNPNQLSNMQQQQQQQQHLQLSQQQQQQQQQQPHSQQQHQQNNNNALMMCSKAQQLPPLMSQKVTMPIDEAPYTTTTHSSMSNQVTSNQSSFGNISSNNSAESSYDQLMSLSPQQYDQSLMMFLMSQNASNNSQQGDYTSPPPNFLIPDLSKPPPGFGGGAGAGSQQGPSEDDIVPTAPYYELPAGLMVPLIRLEDYNYKPLDASDVRLPPPVPKSDRLSAAILAFYSPPSHDRPRDGEGWEKLGLYEYYKVKNAAKKQKEDEIASGIREKSRSPTPLELDMIKPKKLNKRCYRSKSRSRSRSRSRTPPLRKSRSRSRSPQLIERNRNRYAGNRRSRSPKRSPVRERDRDREQREQRERDRERDREQREQREQRDRERDNRNRDRDREERERERQDSPSPPRNQIFFGGNYTKPSEFIEESNKGHQMLMKMGWGGSGTGLGTKNQGIDSPVQAADTRDRNDMYKGLGININDPFENFRKNKGAAFIHRLRTRAEEKS